MCPLPAVQLGNNQPLYNIGVVARITGLAMATLRAWERRYDFPESERTAGGHRLYSEKDVMRLRWVKERIDEGMQTAQAIQALRHQEQIGNLTFVEPLPDLDGEAGGKAQPGLQASFGTQPAEMETFLQHVARQLFEALVQRDLPQADQALADGLTVGPPENVIMKVIAPVFSQIGAAWEKGEISVATEHLATNYLRQRLLMWMLNGPPARTRRTVVLACAPNEWHEGSLLILGALLRRHGFPVVYLGQAVPLPDLAGMVRDLQPDVVVLVAMTEPTATELVSWPEHMSEEARNGHPVIGYGGRIFVQHPEWRQRMKGVYLGNTLHEGLETIERLLSSERG